MKVSEATQEQLDEVLLKAYHAMLATPPDVKQIGHKRLGRVILLDVGHQDDLHISSGMGYGEVYLTKQAIKSATMHFHDPLPSTKIREGKQKK